MIELHDRVEKLLNKLDDEDCIKNNRDLINRVLDNKELVVKINKYNLTKDSKLRLDIYKYEEIIKYKENENDINLLILEINKEFNKRFKRSGCSYENN